MAIFITRYRLTPEFYQELKIKVLTGKSVQAIKDFRDRAQVSLQEAREALLKEFRLEYKLSSDMDLYSCIDRVEQYEGLNNLPIASDISVILEYAKNQLSMGLRNDI